MSKSIGAFIFILGISIASPHMANAQHHLLNDSRGIFGGAEPITQFPQPLRCYPAEHRLSKRSFPNLGSRQLNEPPGAERSGWLFPAIGASLGIVTVGAAMMSICQTEGCGSNPVGTLVLGASMGGAVGGAAGGLLELVVRAAESLGGS